MESEFEADPADPGLARRSLDGLGQLGREVARDHQVRLAGLESRPYRCGRVRVEVQLGREEGHHLGPVGRRHVLGRHDQAVAHHARREDDGAAPVVDLASPAGHGVVVVDLALGARDELVALADLPVAEPDDQCTGSHDEHDQEHEQAAPRISSTDHGDVAR